MVAACIAATNSGRTRPVFSNTFSRIYGNIRSSTDGMRFRERGEVAAAHSAQLCCLFLQSNRPNTAEGEEELEMSLVRRVQAAGQQNTYSKKLEKAQGLDCGALSLGWHVGLHTHAHTQSAHTDTFLETEKRQH